MMLWGGREMKDIQVAQLVTENFSGLRQQQIEFHLLILKTAKHY